MASQAFIVQRILDRIGKKSDAVQRRVETEVSSITIDLLSQNEGRFTVLEKTNTLTFTLDDDRKKLPSDFNTAGELSEVDVDGVFIAECTLTTRKQVRRDYSSSGAYTGYRKGYIDELTSAAAEGAGNYLILADEPSKTVYMQLDYFRKPTANDTDKIRNWTIVEIGVLSRLSQWWPNAQADLTIYERAKLGFVDEPDKWAPDFIMLPNPRITAHNTRMHNIGGGRR